MSATNNDGYEAIIEKILRDVLPDAYSYDLDL